MTTKGKCPVVGMVHPQCDFRDEKCPIHGNMKRPSPAPRPRPSPGITVEPHRLGLSVTIGNVWAGPIVLTIDEGKELRDALTSALAKGGTMTRRSDLWSVYEGETLLYAGEDRQRAFLLFGEAFLRRKEHVRLFRGTEVYAEGYSLKPEGG